MAGGLGNDSCWIDSKDDIIVELEDEGTDTVYSTISYCLVGPFENLTLLGSAVYAGGTDFDNVLIGNAGDNLLDGHAGNDVMTGGLGDDVYCVEDAYDVVNELAAEGVDEIRSTRLVHSVGERGKN